MTATFTGSRAIFKINNEQIAYASSCSYNENHALQPIDVLDSLAPKEYAETGYTVDFTCTSFRVAGKSAKVLGIQPRLEEILTQPELTCEIIDRVTDTVIMRIIGVKITSRSGSVDARGVSTESWSFVGLKASDESGEVTSSI